MAFCQIGNQQGNTADTCHNQNHVGQGAEQHHCKHMLTHQPLAQYKGILRADGEDQRKSEGKPGQERRKQHGRQINREWQAKNARTLSGRAR